MSGSIKNVAVAGAAGSLGTVILNKLIESNKFNIKVLRRNGSKSTYGAGINVVDVDFESVASLKAALAGQDAVVAPVGFPALSLQNQLIDASIEAGVQRFIPSEFGSDLENALTRKLPVFASKVAVADYLAEKAKSTSLTYTLVSNGAFLDWGLEKGFILDTSEYKPTIFDGGDAPFSTSTLSTVGDAVVGILLHPNETKNRAVYVEDLQVTQNQLLTLAKQVAPNKPWQPQANTLDAVTKRSDERLAQKLFDEETMVPYIYRAIFDPAYGNVFKKTDNALLGLKGRTEADITDILRRVVKA
ncbi:putative oxidoreductase - protein [Drechmeria coniospora]|uniref:Putative oxidoreductase-protein n=1 Tax=Drechmeria coniospora TaxID=98403 RepID=A0A151GDA3_DRECN|nr:putative oxidoreductase - protein [Drechmeria coniospora]KYK55043.1 putative oxidoreductase - protein [Drechmeria coniospora]ODA82330.1 hypothetical protein RJ55_00837 [Drechmeria coniospora]